MTNVGEIHPGKNQRLQQSTTVNTIIISLSISLIKVQFPWKHIHEDLYAIST